MHPDYPQPKSNRLLALLPSDVLARLVPDLLPIDLILRQPLYSTDAPIDWVYFPVAGMISMVANMDDGTQVEVGLIGSEGMLGTTLLAGSDKPFAESMVQMLGAAWRMATAPFLAALEAEPAFRKMLMRYGEALQCQIMQTAACNSRHELDHRLSRWLLMAHDRAEGDDLPLTQGFIAAMLGVHRPTVSNAAQFLQSAGLIRYSGDGNITILDRPGLEAMTCECHGVVQRRFSDLLGGTFLNRR